MVFDNFAIECFIVVAQTSSFTRASQYLGRTQSAISQQIAKIESYLEKKLFVRGKNITLTVDGEAFYNYAKQIYDLHQQAIQHFKDPNVQGEVKFGLPEDFVTIFLDSVLQEFSRIHPNVTINIECDLSLNLLQRFKNHEFDMILLKINRPEDFENSLAVWSEKLEWVGNKHLIRSFHIEKNLPLVLSPTPCLYRSRALEALDEASLKWQIVFTSTSYNSKIAAVKAGLGLTVLPRSMVPNHLGIINHSDLPALNDTHVSLLKHNQNHPIIATFEKFIIKKLKH